MEAAAWRESTPNGDFLYRLQVNNIDARSIRRIVRICSDWDHAGYGWSSSTKYKILLFARCFKTQKEWLKWAKQFPYKLVELNGRGQPKPIKLGLDYINKKQKRRKQFEFNEKDQKERRVIKRSS